MENEGYGVEERAAENAFVFECGIKLTRSRRAMPMSRSVEEAEHEASLGDDEDSDRESASWKRKRGYHQASGLEAASVGEPCKRSRVDCIDEIVAEGDALVLAESAGVMYIGALYRPETMAVAVHTTKARNAAKQEVVGELNGC